MKKDFSYGVIPIYKESDGTYSILILKQAERHKGPTAGFWGFPKGHKDAGESDIQAARRELAEEAGIDDCEIIEDVIFVDKYIHVFDDVTIDKTVTHFPAFVSSKLAHMESEHNKEHGESIELKWIAPEEMSKYLTFKNQDVLVSKIQEWLQDK